MLEKPGTSRRGLLVPVANPEGVAPLLAIAFAASAPDDPPARVLALVEAQQGNAKTGKPSHPEAMKTAMEYASSRGVTIDPFAMWSANPGADIIGAAREANAGWILLGYHRASEGTGTMGGVV